MIVVRRMRLFEPDRVRAGRFCARLGFDIQGGPPVSGWKIDKATAQFGDWPPEIAGEVYVCA
jgi:hypothetical protein